MNILITGINGLVGKGIASVLSHNHKIIGISKSHSNKTGLVIDYYSIDISKDIETEKIYKLDFDLIIHCAASLDKDPFSIELITTNCNGIRNIAKLVKEKKCKIIYISSIPIIGDPIQIPITELHPVNPKNNYHLTKFFGEVYLNNTIDKKNLVIIRLPSPIGRDLPQNRILSVFVKRALQNEDITLLGEGKRIQNYINVIDIGDAINKIINNDIFGVYNIAHVKSFSNRELAERCISVLSSKTRIKYNGEDPEENVKWIISIEKAINDFNFYPNISMEQSIVEIANTYLNENIVY